MAYPYFGFTQPGNSSGLMTPNAQYPGATPGVSYQGAMPAALGGVGASPNASVASGSTPNMSAIAPLAMMNAQMMSQGPTSQPQSLGNTMGQMTPQLMALMKNNPQMMQQMQGGMQGLMGNLGGMFGGGGASGASLLGAAGVPGGGTA
jgi:hypothetical protein